MRRRAFLGLIGAAAAWPLTARARAKIPRIGYFWNDFPDPNVGVAGLRQGLQERGYVLGRNLLLEERYAEGDPSRARELIAELLALGVDVLATGDFALIQAHALTATVPIVGVAGDFVGVGLAAKLSRPGGNVTGLSLLSAELGPKWLELLQAAVPAGALSFGRNGGLFGYDVDIAPMYRRAATFVHKILKGAKPGDIPIEQATKFTTIVNLKIANALGIDIPPMLLAQADEVIE